MMIVVITAGDEIFVAYLRIGFPIVLSGVIMAVIATALESFLIVVLVRAFEAAMMTAMIAAVMVVMIVMGMRVMLAVTWHSRGRQGYDKIRRLEISVKDTPRVEEARPLQRLS